MIKQKIPIAKFNVGDWVSFRWGVRDVVAQILEQRGPILKGRQHLYRVRLKLESFEDMFEMPEDKLEPASPPSRVSASKPIAP